MEELTRVLVPLIEESVKRHMESLALRISHNLERGEAACRLPLKLDPNQTDNDPRRLHTDAAQTLSQHQSQKSLHTDLSKTLSQHQSQESLHPDPGPSQTLSQHQREESGPGSRVGAGRGDLEEECRQTLSSWGLDTRKDKNYNHEENFLSLGFKKTTLQDYFIGEF